MLGLDYRHVASCPIVCIKPRASCLLGKHSHWPLENVSPGVRSWGALPFCDWQRLPFSTDLFGDLEFPRCRSSLALLTLSLTSLSSVTVSISFHLKMCIFIWCVQVFCLHGWLCTICMQFLWSAEGGAGASGGHFSVQKKWSYSLLSSKNLNFAFI